MRKFQCFRPMHLQQVSAHCFAALADNNRLCDANSGLITLDGGAVIDTQADLRHARRMMELFREVSPDPPRRVINTHEDIDHVAGNSLFEGAEIIAHRAVRDEIDHVADPRRLQWLMRGVRTAPLQWLLRCVHPGVVALGRQLKEDYDFAGIRVVPPTTVFDDRLTLELDGVQLQLIHVGPSHQRGDTLVHLPDEGVLFSGDIVFHGCTPVGWVGTYDNWLRALDLITSIQPAVIVPGHGPVCDLETVSAMKEYLQLVRQESRRHFDAGLPVFEATKRIDIGPYRQWRAPARLFLNVARAYREFRGERFDTPWSQRRVFDAIFRIAVARGWPVEF